MHARHDALDVLIDDLEYIHADPRHDPHIHDHVSGIGQLHSDLRHRRINRAHAERQDIHRASAHAAVEQSLQSAPHHVWIFPVIRRTGIVLGKRTYKGAVLYAGNIALIRARVVAIRPQLLVQPDKCALVHQLLAECLVLLFRAVDPMNVIRLGEFRHLFNPPKQVLILAERSGLSTGTGNGG